MGFMDKFKVLVGIDEEDEEEYEDEVVPERKPADVRPLPQPRQENKEGRVVAMAPAPAPAPAKSATTQLKLVVTEPQTFDECPKLVDSLKARKPIIINLEKVETYLTEITGLEQQIEALVAPELETPLSTGAIIKGTPAKGYQVSKVTVSPDTLRVAGDEDALDAVELLFAENAVDVSGASESFTASLRARKPSDLEYVSAESITVSVEIEPVTISRTFSSVKLSAQGIGSGLNVSLSHKTLSAVLTGPQLLLESLRTAHVSAYVDVTDLKAGEYELPVEIHLENASMDDVDFITTPASVQVTITEP